MMTWLAATRQREEAGTSKFNSKQKIDSNGVLCQMQWETLKYVGFDHRNDNINADIGADTGHRCCHPKSGYQSLSDI